MKKFYVFIFLCISTLAISQSMEKDTSFNPFTLPADNYYVDGTATKCLVQPDGKILIVEASYVNPTKSKLTRINVNNTIDASFANATVYNGVIKDMALQADGKILIVGSFTTVDGASSKYIVRLNADGTRDIGFNVGTGFGAYSNSNYPFASAVAIRPDGKIFVGGDLSNYNGIYKDSLFLLNADGTLDTSFTIVSSLNNLSIAHIFLMDDGRMIITDQFFGDIFRLNADGTKDSTFLTGVHLDAASGSVDGAILNALVVLPDGKILIGGRFDAATEVPRRDFVRLNSDGSVDGSFVSTGFDLGFLDLDGTRNGVTSILVQPDGKMIVAGDFRKYLTSSPNGIVRLNTDLSIDTSFAGGIDVDASDTIHYFSYFTSLVWHPDGDIVGVGRFSNYNNISSNNCVKFHSDGSKDNSFNNICRGFDQSMQKFELQPDGKILTIGLFHSYNGVYRDRIARLNADGSLDTGFNVQTSSFMFDYFSPWDIKLQSDGKIIIASDGRYFNSTKGGALMRLNADGSNDYTFNPLTPGNYGVRGQCLSVAIQPDGKILAAGGFYYGNSSTIIRLARFNTDGTLDTTFQYTATTFASLSRIELLPDGKILVIGKVDNYSSKIIRLLTDGTIDSSFTMASSLYFVNNKNLYMDVQPDGKILVTSDSPGYNRHALARINSDGTLDSSFSFTNLTPYFYAYQCATAFLPDGRILIATPNSITTTALKRINANGSLDTGFDIGTGFGDGFGYSNGASDKMAALKVQPDGKILCGGGFRTFQGVPERGIARLLNNSLGTSEFSTNNRLVLYPNPTRSILNISDVAIESNFKIFNLLGQEVKSGKIQDKCVDVSSLNAGIYIIEVQKDSLFIRERFIKQ